MNAEDVKIVKGAFRFDGRPIIRNVNHLTHLPQFDQQLRRVRRHNQYIRVRLDQDPGLAFVRVAQFVASLYRLGHALFKIGRRRYANAVAATPAKVRKTVTFHRFEAIHHLRQHQRKRVLACTLRPGQNQRLRKMIAADTLPQSPYRRRIADKIPKPHRSSLVHAAESPVVAAGTHSGSARLSNYRSPCNLAIGIALMPFLGRSVIFGCNSIVWPDASLEPPSLGDRS